MLAVVITCFLKIVRGHKLLSGFPMSKGAKLSDLMLGKSIRDLACQVRSQFMILIFVSVLEHSKAL